MRIKQTITLLLVFSFLLLCGCSNSDFQSEWSTDSSGNNVMTNRTGNTTFPENLPAQIAYNSSIITITNVSLFQDLSSSYKHTLFLIVAVDVSNLDDAQTHWLRESDIDIKAYLTSESNQYDFNSMPMLGNLLLTDKDIIYYVLTSSFFKDNRYDFAGSKITLSVDVTQEETYEYKNDDGEISNLNKKEGIHYSFNVADNLPGSSEIQEPLYGYIDKWIVNYGNLFK